MKEYVGAEVKLHSFLASGFDRGRRLATQGYLFSVYKHNINLLSVIDNHILV